MKPLKPKTNKSKRQRRLSQVTLLAALHARFKANGKEEARNVLLMRKTCKAIAAHDAATRGTVWFCAANVIADEMAANSGWTALLKDKRK
jgi:hypothetical protein